VLSRGANPAAMSGSILEPGMLVESVMSEVVSLHIHLETLDRRALYFTVIPAGSSNNDGFGSLRLMPVRR